MTKRDEFLKEYREYREYQEALQGAEKRKPEGSWYKVPADDDSEEAEAQYYSCDDILELSISGKDVIRIPGKYLRSLYSALGDLVSESGHIGDKPAGYNVYVSTVCNGRCPHDTMPIRYGGSGGGTDCTGAGGKG